MKVKILTCDAPSVITGRVYPKEEVEAAVNKYRDAITKGLALGEFGQGGSNVNLERVSHIVEDMLFEGSDLYAEIRVLETPMGKILKQLIDANATVRIAPAFVGVVDQTTGKASHLELVKTEVYSGAD